MYSTEKLCLWILGTCFGAISIFFAIWQSCPSKLSSHEIPLKDSVPLGICHLHESWSIFFEEKQVTLTKTSGQQGWDGMSYHSWSDWCDWCDWFEALARTNQGSHTCTHGARKRVWNYPELLQVFNESHCGRRRRWDLWCGAPDSTKWY